MNIVQTYNIQLFYVKNGRESIEEKNQLKIEQNNRSKVAPVGFSCLRALFGERRKANLPPAVSPTKKHPAQRQSSR